MRTEYEAVEPERAVELYLEAREDDAAESTIESHASRLRPFVEWCDEEGIERMDEINGRDLHEYRMWRRDGNYSGSKTEKLAPPTLKTQLTTVRMFLRFVEQIDACPEDLYLKVPLPIVSKDDAVSDSYIDPSRVPAILEYLTKYKYASRDHVITLLLWHCGARTGGIQALDLKDVELHVEKPHLHFKHRPSTGTRLKNGQKSERANRIGPRVVDVLDDYIQDQRHDVTDEHGREPLLTTAQGRIHASTVRVTIYRVTRPCWIGEQCPEGKDPDSCEWNSYQQASKCPATRNPHDFRKARVTKFRDDGVSRELVGDELDASNEILDKHYDRANEKQRADRRWREMVR